MEELSKYFSQSTIEVLKRSTIHLSTYNPRKIDADGKKQLKRSLKTCGVLGGIIVNKQTGYTVVGGHQKVAILDEMSHFDPNTNEGDYTLRVEVIDVDLKREKEINILLNNPNVGGSWDFDALRQLVPDIDYKNAGLTEADLSMIGVDFNFQTELESGLSAELDNIMKPADDRHREEVAQRAELREAQREAIAQAQQEANAQQKEMDRQARIDHMKDVKAEVREQAMHRAQDNEAYLMLSFDNFQSKQEFCEMFGIDPYQKFFKGEAFRDMIEGNDSVEL